MDQKFATEDVTEFKIRSAVCRIIGISRILLGDPGTVDGKVLVYGRFRLGNCVHPRFLHQIS